MVDFMPNEQMKSLEVFIIDDDILEIDESVTFVLRTDVSGVSILLDQHISYIVVLDNEGKIHWIQAHNVTRQSFIIDIVLGFSNEEFRVPEVPIIAEIGLDVFEPNISDVSPEFFMSGARFFIDSYHISWELKNWRPTVHWCYGYDWYYSRAGWTSVSGAFHTTNRAITFWDRWV